MDGRDHAKAIFHAALERSASDRGQFLDAACGDDVALRRELDILLAAHDEAQSFLETPAAIEFAAVRAGVETITAHPHNRIAADTRLGPYEIVDLVGTGGMGEVYRARDTRLERTVAIKILPSHVAGDPQLRERFDREAKVLAALSHPNIVAIHDVGTHDGIPYAAMELLDGVTLRERIGGAALPLRTTVDYGVQIGRGLAAAHDKGIVHRDLKPDNIFVTRDGLVKILDFGLAGERATAAAAASAATRAPGTERGTMLGTVGYLSPEQARGETADSRSDIFSFGCVLYEMASGHRAFSGDTGIETLHAILKDNPPDLLASGRDIPPALDRLIMRCVEKAASARFQTARDLVFALENLLDGSAPVTHKVPARWNGRRRGWAMAAVIVMGLAAAGVGWWAVGHWTRSAASVAMSKPAASAPRVLAVLPFENITLDGKPGYFGAGMTEEVMSKLSKLNALRVVSRTAVARFKDVRTDLAAMVSELGIGSVVTGSVREDGARVRVNVELVDARSGQQLWSEQYDRDTTDVFAVQSDIALRVADALKASVTLDEQARLGKRPTSNIAAYELLIRARGLRAGSGLAQFQAKIDLLQQAVALDPQFALAYGQMASLYAFMAANGDPSAIARGLDAGNTAIVIDPQLAQGHLGLGQNLNEAGRRREALQALRKAAKLDPSFDAAILDLSVVEVNAGRFDEALTSSKRGLQLSPNLSYSYYHVGGPLLFLDDDARTERFLTKAETRFPAAQRLQILLAYLDVRRGRPEAALDRIRRAVDAAPDNIEGLIDRSEIATLTAAPDAARLTQALLADSGEAVGELGSYSIKLLHAYHLHAAGQTDRAAALMNEILNANQKAIDAGAEWATPFMQNAAIHAVRGESGAALDWLDRAYDAGWRDARTLAHDPLLGSISREPRFAKLVSRIEADVATMRARADYAGLGF
jgi:TolB-like protein/Flp pilus assembly protein TadD